YIKNIMLLYVSGIYMEIDIAFITFFFIAYTSIFTIMNPFVSTSVFLSITKGDSKASKRMQARKAAITAALVLMIFGVAGNLIFSFFSITLDAFLIAGGLIIAQIGFNMLKDREVIKEPQEEEAVIKKDVSITPLAIPMMSGPGAIATSLVITSRAESVIDLFAFFAAVIAVCITAYFIISRSAVIHKVLGENGAKAADKILGLIVLVMGVQLIINGVSGLIEAWFK
ncbi:MAG: MarC family protein, partial [Candidatus Woesearchaeota archaeon]